jgi:hypothetical protein
MHFARLQEICSSFQKTPLLWFHPLTKKVLLDRVVEVDSRASANSHHPQTHPPVKP